MARLCPFCERPNADAALRCLYCAKPLPHVPAGQTRKAVTRGASSESESESESGGAPTEVPSDRFLLVLLPVPGTEPDRAVAFARAVGIDPYDARLLLQSGRPRLLRKIDAEATARALSERLTSARIGHYVVTESSVLSLPVSRARGAVLHDRHIELVVDGHTLSLRFENLLLLVRGEIARERRDDKRLGTPRGVSDRITPGLRLHLYERNATVAVEIDPEHFDWTQPSLASPSAAGSSLIHFQNLLERLRERAASAELDRGFDREPVVLARSEANEDLTELLTEGRARRDGIVYDNEAQFRMYARLRYRIAEHLARRFR